MDLPFVWSLDRTASVGTALLAAKRRLAESGSESAELDSVVLMGHVLGVSKAWLYAYPNRALAEAEIIAFELLVRRRIQHEPVAYLVGFKSFFGLDLSVDRRVLIPRPETEQVVERAVDCARALQARGASLHIADIGTGSGALAVALAVNLPQVSIYATDSSEDALAVASQNVWRYGVGEQVQLLPGHLCDPLPEPVDIVVANLPYVATPDLAHLPPQVRDFEPWLALDGGPAGLQVIAQLLADLSGPARAKKLRPGARIFLEIGAAQGNAVHALALAAFPDAVVGVWQDYADLDRLVIIAT